MLAHVLLLALAMPALAQESGGQGAPFLCPAFPSDSPALDHWASPSRANAYDKVPAPCRSCDDPRNAGAKACTVRRFITSPLCAGGRCSDSQGEFMADRKADGGFVLQYDTRFQSPDRYPRAAGENCRFILWARDPVIGIEDVNGLSARNFWSDAYFASQSLVTPPFALDGLAFLAQSALNRSQHQLHIHIGTLAPPYLAAFAGLDPAAGDAVTRLHVNGYDARVRVFPVSPGSDPFASRDIGAIARGMLPGGASDLTTHGILAALVGGGSRLVVLVARRLDRVELNYKAPHACRLR
ncbi:CDP-diacylglycerol diphosphatase [Aquabacter sp. L1I39]|uniref:CDP-diacylglycerol diphosphatase n=1 Tax=Aquabacter sp. L1I39 TaxID=2820278 RepID=UPI001FFDDE36|nr:CDP-diacylglycerol diphosphatase [Aquabacter sp. L1I39]